ncbi:hypothetical protein AMK33_01355 [Streptomyces sp. CB02400]|nr:hypothetical protein AMK33_01355 [Streptomyces sp. CB02400]
MTSDVASPARRASPCSASIAWTASADSHGVCDWVRRTSAGSVGGSYGSSTPVSPVSMPAA